MTIKDFVLIIFEKTLNGDTSLTACDFMRDILNMEILSDEDMSKYFYTVFDAAEYLGYGLSITKTKFEQSILKIGDKEFIPKEIIKRIKT